MTTINEHLPRVQDGLKTRLGPHTPTQVRGLYVRARMIKCVVCARHINHVMLLVRPIAATGALVRIRTPIMAAHEPPLPPLHMTWGGT
jgi:hypothetical protein